MFASKAEFEGWKESRLSNPEPMAAKRGLSPISGLGFRCPRAENRPVVARRMTLPESYTEVARHTSQKVTPCEPGELRSCPTLTQSLSNTCARSPTWPNICKRWPSLAQIGQILTSLMSFGHQIGAPRFDRLWPTLVQTSGNIDEFGQCSARVAPFWARSRLREQSFDNLWAALAQLRNSPGSLRVTSQDVMRAACPRRFGHVTEFSLPQLASPGPPASQVWEHRTGLSAVGRASRKLQVVGTKEKGQPQRRLLRHRPSSAVVGGTRMRLEVGQARLERGICQRFHAKAFWAIALRWCCAHHEGECLGAIAGHHECWLHRGMALAR